MLLLRKNFAKLNKQYIIYVKYFLTAVHRYLWIILNFLAEKEMIDLKWNKNVSNDNKKTKLGE